MCCHPEIMFTVRKWLHHARLFPHTPHSGFCLLFSIMKCFSCLISFKAVHRKLMKSWTTLQSKHMLPYSFRNRGGVHVERTILVSASWLGIIYHCLHCHFDKGLSCWMLGMMSLFSIFYIPHKIFTAKCTLSSQPSPILYRALQEPSLLTVYRPSLE